MARVHSSGFHPFKSEAARERYLSQCELMEHDWPIQSQCQTVETDCGETFIRISGPAAAPPLVLLPGANVNSLCWMGMVKSLSEHFRTYAVDAIYDAGRSIPSRELPLMADRIAWLDGLFGELGLEDGINLMGLSYGGCVTAHYTIHAPERLAKSVWVAPAITVAPMGKGFMLHLVPSILPTRAGTGSFMRWLMPEMRQNYRDQFENLVDEVYLARKCNKALAMTTENVVLADKQLSEITVPVLFIIGEKDGVVDDPTSTAARLNDVAPRFETALVSDGHHDMVLTRADEVSSRVLRFLGA